MEHEPKERTDGDCDVEVYAVGNVRSVFFQVDISFLRESLRVFKTSTRSRILRHCSSNWSGSWTLEIDERNSRATQGVSRTST